MGVVGGLGVVVVSRPPGLSSLDHHPDLDQVVGEHPVAAPGAGTVETRDVPLPATVAEELAERIRQYPPGGGGLVFTTRQGGPLTRSYYNRNVWRPALKAAGVVEPSRATGMHQLRHAYITRLLSEGVNPRAVADWVGHSDIGYMLKVYGHVLPNDNDRARAVIDTALGRRADQVRTSEAD